MYTREKAWLLLRRLIALILMLGLCLTGCSQQTKTAESSCSCECSCTECGCSYSPGQTQSEEPAELPNDTEEQEGAAVEKETANVLTGIETVPSPEAPAEKEEKQASAVLLFASDYQHRDGWKDPPAYGTISSTLEH